MTGATDWTEAEVEAARRVEETAWLAATIEVLRQRCVLLQLEIQRRDQELAILRKPRKAAG